MYSVKSSLGCLIPNGSGVLAADVLTSTGVHGEYIALSHVALDRLLLIVSTTVNTASPVVVQFKKRSAPGVSSGEVVLGSLSIPHLTAAGKVLYKNINEAEFQAGEALAIEVTTAASSSVPLGITAAGGCLYGFELQESPEDPRNEPNMIASA
jgi:hypothetical protein